MHLTIQTPERTVVDETAVAAVQAEMADGQFGVLPGHVPMTAALKMALLEYTPEGSAAKQTIAVMGGILQTDGKQVTVLAEVAEKAADIDKFRAEQAKARAEARLQSRDAETDTQRAEMALARSLVRLKAFK